MKYEWAVGVALSVLGAAIDNCGITLQKYSHILEAKKPPSERRPYIKQKQWLLGMTLFLFGNALNAIGLSFAAQTLFAALGASALVANSINSFFFLGEDYTRRVFFATVLIVGGSILAVSFGTHDPENYTVEDLETFFGYTFMGYALVVAFLLLSLFITIFILDKRLRARAVILYPMRKERVRRESSIDVGQLAHPILVVFPDRAHSRSESGNEWQSLLTKVSESVPAPGDASNDSSSPVPTSQGYNTFTSNASASPTPTGDAPHRKHKHIMPHTLAERYLSFAYPAFAGLVGSITVLLAKASALLIKTSAKGDNQFSHPLPYVLLFGTAVSGVLQIHWINLGLKRFDQLIVVPSFYVVFTTFSILGGAFYFNEFSDMDSTSMAVFPVATMITFVGVFIIATRPIKHRHHHREDTLSISESGSKPLLDQPGGQPSDAAHRIVDMLENEDYIVSPFIAPVPADEESDASVESPSPEAKRDRGHLITGAGNSGQPIKPARTRMQKISSGAISAIDSPGPSYIGGTPASLLSEAMGPPVATPSEPLLSERLPESQDGL